MKLDFAFFADAGNIQENGTFDVIGGGFDVLKGRKFPSAINSFIVISRVHFDPNECGKSHEIRGVLLSHDGTAVIDEVKTTVTPSPHPRNPKESNWVTFGMTFQNVYVLAPGEYQFCLWVGNNPIGHIILEAVVEEVKLRLVPSMKPSLEMIRSARGSLRHLKNSETEKFLQDRHQDAENGN